MSCFIPGVIFHLSLWYPAERLPMRIVGIAAFSQLAGTFSGLLAFAISNLNGRLGLSGWRYLFVLESLPVWLCGICVTCVLPNHPETAKFLTAEEKKVIVDNLALTQPRSEDNGLNWRVLWDFVKDPVTHTFLLIWIAHAIGCSGLTTVVPTIIYDLGIGDSLHSQLMTMPLYVAGEVILLGVAWLVQKRKINSWGTSMILEVGTCGCCIALIFVKAPVARYAFVTIAAILSFTLLPIPWPERIRASQGTTHAALAIGVTSASNSLHGILGPLVYQSSFGPMYKTSFSIAFGLAWLAVLGIGMTWLILRKREHATPKDQGRPASESAIALRELS